MGTCKAVVLEGARKGESCMFPAGENLYCGRHQRNYLYEKLINEGKIPCRFFFRGCDTILDSSTPPSCSSCREKISTKSSPCSHKGCKFKTHGDKYCKKHERDKYYDEEIEKGIKYCDITRGCFTICENGLKSCRNCLDKDIIKDSTRRKENTIIHIALKEDKNTIHQLCCNCGKDYEKYLTLHNTPSKLCKHCNKIQHTQDNKRIERKRNYKNENLRNLERYYKEYITNAIKREYSMELQFNDFEKLVKQPCYYCDYSKENEVNGIDRVNNTKGYSKENCVTCCEICNKIKLMYHPLFFIEKCQIISKQLQVSDEFYKTWSEYYYRCIPHNYNSYKKQAVNKRGLKFNITKEEWSILTQDSCYLCGYKNIKGIGLDRVVNTVREYTIENVKPCCGSCNIMKSDLVLSIFLEKANKIAIKWKDITMFKSIPYNNIIEEPKNTILKIKTLQNRKNWKSTGVYNSILNKSDEFYESQKVIFTEEEFSKLKNVISSKNKEESIEYIQRLLSKLNKRRKRL